MCLATLLKIHSITTDIATMADGRKVKLGPLASHVVVGDYLEVYANIAIAKVAKADVAFVQSLRKVSI